MLFGKPVGGAQQQAPPAQWPVTAPAAQPATAFSFGQASAAGSGFGKQARQSFAFGTQVADGATGMQSPPLSSQMALRMGGSPARSPAEPRGMQQGGFGLNWPGGSPQGGRGGRGGRGELSGPAGGRGRGAHTWSLSDNPPAAQATNNSKAEEEAAKAKRAARFQTTLAPPPDQPRSASPAMGSSPEGLKRGIPAFGRVQTQQQQRQRQTALANSFPAADEEDGGGMEEDGAGGSTPPPFVSRAPSPAMSPSAYQGDADVDNDGLIITGTCPFMCPVEERGERSSSNALHPLERPFPQRPDLTYEHLMVKRNVRNYDDTDQKPELFRTLPALTDTMNHLMSVMDWTTQDHPSSTPGNIYSLLWDRFREVRKELKTQRFHVRPETLPQAVEWNEWMCRYLLMCGHELVGQEGYTAHLNQEQMTKGMMDLMDFYSTAERMDAPSPNSAEFKCYFAIMTYAGLVNKAGNKPANRQGGMELLRAFTPSEQTTPWFTTALVALDLLSKREVATFWKLSREAPYVLACVLYTQFGMMQAAGTALEGDRVQKQQAAPPRLSFWQEDMPDLATDKTPVDWISDKHQGLYREAVTTDPIPSQEFLNMVARLAGKAPGATQWRAPPPAGYGAPARATPAPRRVLPPQPVVQPAPVAKPAPQAFVSPARPSQPAAVDRFSPADAAVTAAAVFGQGGGFTGMAAVPPASQGPVWFAAAHAAQAQQEQEQAGLQQHSAHQLQAAAAAAGREVAAATQEAARHRADAEAARQAQQHALMQSQALQQQVMEARHHQMQIEHMRHAAAHQAEQLQQRVAQQAAQLESLAAEKAAAEQSLSKRLLQDKEAALTRALQLSLQRRTLQLWCEAAQVRRRRIYDQMARCRIDLVARGGSAPSPASPRLATAGPAAAAAGAASSKRLCRRLTGPDAAMAAASVAPPQPLTPPLPLGEFVLPTLHGALVAGGWRHDPGHARLSPEPAVWKLVVCTGLEQQQQSDQQQQPQQPQQQLPLSFLHESAALWLQRRLSAGRDGTSYQPPSGSVLCLNLPPPAPSATPRIALCVEDLCAPSVAAEPVLVPEHSSPSMTATSAIMILVDGPGEQWTPPPLPPQPQPQPQSPAAATGRARGGSPRHAAPAPVPSVLPMELHAPLNQSWEHLKMLLSRLAPQVHVPVVVLALANEAGCTAIASHLGACAAQWPVAVSSRLASCSVLPLLPMTRADHVIIQALHTLASAPPGPFLLSGGCPDVTPSSNPNSPRWAVAQAGGGLAEVAAASVSGPPRRLGIEGLVQQVLAQCLEEHQPGLQLSRWQGEDDWQSRPQRIVASFNTSLEALARGIHASASHTLASWGLPTPELSPSDSSAPACWQAARVQQAADAVLRARVPLTSLPQTAGATEAEAYEKVASLLRALCTQWAEGLRKAGGPLHCVILPRYQPAAVANALSVLRPARMPFHWTAPPPAQQHPTNGLLMLRGSDALDAAAGTLDYARLPPGPFNGRVEQGSWQHLGEAAAGAAGQALLFGGFRPTHDTPYAAQQPAQCAQPSPNHTTHRMRALSHVADRSDYADTPTRGQHSPPAGGASPLPRHTGMSDSGTTPGCWEERDGSPMDAMMRGADVPHVPLVPQGRGSIQSDNELALQVLRELEEVLRVQEALDN